MLGEPRPEPAAAAEEEHEEQPGTTGETEKGRSTRVTQSSRPRGLNFPSAQAAARPKRALAGTTMPATFRVRAIAAAPPARPPPPPGAQALRERLRQHHHERQHQQAAEEDDGERDQQHAHHGRLGGGRAAGGGTAAEAPRGSRGHAVYASTVARRRASQRGSRWMEKSTTKEATSIPAPSAVATS